MADFASIRFQPSRPLLRELSADRLNSILAEIKRNKPLPGRGITVRQTGQGTAIDLAAAISRGASTSTDHPFKVLVRQFEEDGPYFWGVVNNSKLFRNITGLDPGLDGRLAAEASDDDPNWLQINATEDTDFIYIEYDATENTYTINSTGNGGAYDGAASFPNENALIEMDLTTIPATLLFARKVIAIAEPPAEAGQPPIIMQGIKQHQLVQDVIFSGYPVVYFFDYTVI